MSKPCNLGIQVQVCLTEASDYVLWATVTVPMAMEKGVTLKMKLLRDLPGGPVVNNTPCNAGDAGLIPV